MQLYAADQAVLVLSYLLVGQHARHVSTVCCHSSSGSTVLVQLITAYTL
jgi:hypothetical protein